MPSKLQDYLEACAEWKRQRDALPSAPPYPQVEVKGCKVTFIDDSFFISKENPAYAYHTATGVERFDMIIPMDMALPIAEFIVDLLKSE